MVLDNSKNLFHSSKKIIPGGVNSPVRAFNAVGGVPPFIEKAKGAYVYDVDGNEYVDFVGSWGPMILGHAHPHVLNAVRSTIDGGLSFGAPTEKEMILAEMIIERVPGCGMVRLVNSGTEATMSVIRLARGVTGKSKIIKFAGCYHGHADSFLIEAGSGSLTFGKPNSPGVTKEAASNTLIAEFNSIESVEDILKENNNEIAGIIIEPVNGNAGCILPKEDFLKKLRVLCDAYGCLLIFDEVMTGFRIAKGGAAEYFSVIPDLYAFGKIIGGGMPIGAYGGKKDLMKEIAPIGSIYQAGTLSGNPVAVSAGIATLELLNDDVYEKLESMGSYFENELNKVFDKHDHEIYLERIGSMFSLFFHSGPIRNVEDVEKCNFKLFSKYFHCLLRAGIYIAPSQYEVGFISLAHDRRILDFTISTIDEILNEIMVPVS